MKKSIIALMGLFMLVACSEDVYQEADKMSKNGTVENNSGGMQTNSVDPDIPYESPYDALFNNTKHINYIIDNQFTDQIEIIGHFGIGYYDGADDGNYFNFDLPSNIAPTIYNNNNIEYLNTVYSTNVIFPASTTITLADNKAPVHDTANPYTFFVDSSLGNGNAVGLEPELIYQTGKMYFLDFNIPSIGYSGRIKVKFGDDMMDYATLSGISSDWDLIGSNITGIPGDLVYNIHTQEICLANDFSGNGLKSEDRFVDRLGNVWFVRAYTDINSVYIEVTP